MESLNRFNSMNSDLSKFIQNNDKYLKALNLRPVTTLGESNGGLTNIMGNNCEITFPNLRGVYKLKIEKAYAGDEFIPQTVIITINGQSTSTITLDLNTSPKDIVPYIKSLSNCYENTFNTYKTFAVAYDNEYIYIYQNPEYRLCATNESVEPTIVLTKGGAGTELVYIKPDGTTSTSQTPFILPNNSYDKLVIIGSTYIEEDNYLFTCVENNTQKTGNIWKLTYDELTGFSYIKLLVNAYLNFDINYPIPPTATIGRYELPTIQRIYWSDFNNPIRSLNTASENSMSFNSIVLDLKPALEMSIPTLKTITAGNGVDDLSCATPYYFAYRLVKNNDTVTNYSPMSNGVKLIKQNTGNFISPAANFSSITGTDINGNVETVNKSITIEVNGVDTNYDKIEFVVIKGNSADNTLYTIHKYEEQLIGNSSTIVSEFTNDTATFIDIEDSEFLIDNVTFTHCKTIDQKDNRLFFGNIKNDLGTYLETFDTRTYRFASISNITRVKQFEKSITPINYVITSDAVYSTISETNDNIPVLNLGLDTADDPYYDNSYKHKINSTIVGGSGLNIDYSFGNLFLNADSVATGPLTTPVGQKKQGTERDVNTYTQLYQNGYRIAGYNSNALSFLNSTFDNGSVDQTYYLNSAKQTQGLEYYNDNFRTYELNEIYRFAIVFKSKIGTEYFAKWIGDIKFPNYTDTSDPALRDYTASGAQCTDFRSMFLDGANAYLNLPYIQFNVNIPQQLADLISGYEIVRVDRTDDDMSILSHGFINQVSVGVGSQNDNYFLPVSHSARDGGSYNMDPVIAPANPYQAPYASDEIITYHPFRELADKQTRLGVNDKLIIAEKYKTSIVSAFNITNVNETGNYEQDYYIAKYYDYITTYSGTTSDNSRFNILEGHYVEYGNTVAINGNTYKNYNYQWDDVAPTTYDSDAYALGCPTVVVSLEQNIDWTDYNAGGNDVTSPMTNPVGASLGTGAGNCKLMAYHFKPTSLLSQYGGRTYLARTQNEYISTGAFCKVDTAGQTNIKVFGGDIYYGVQDTMKAIMNFGQLTTPTTAPQRHSQTFYFPTHSIYNIDLRGGLHTNADLTDDASISTSCASEEQYFYAKGYSHFNLLKKYLPKPDSFNSTNDYKNRIYWSNVKINGSSLDDWSIIPTNNNYDVDGNCGGINSLITLANNMYCIQDNGFSILHINPVSIITDQNNLPLNLGTGEVLQKHLYYSTDVGSKYQWSVSKSPSAITFVNGRYNKIYLFNGESLLPISDSKGARGFMNKVMHDDILVNDNPIIGKGIVTTYDYTNDEFLYTFRNNFIDNINERYTITYNVLIDGFTSFYSFTPYVYINNHSKIYSPNDYNINSSTKIYMHNKGNYCEFYDGVFPSELKVMINDNPTKTKVFDNLSWSTESIKNNEVYLDDINDFTGNSNRINFVDDTIKSIRIYNEYQNTGFVTLTNTPVTGNLRKTEQGFNIQVPRNKVNWDTTPINTKSIFDASILTKDTFGERIRDKYIIVDLIYDNALSNRFSIHNIKTTYRTSDR